MTDDLRGPSSTELTTQQAADLLNVSVPFLIGLLEAGEIEHRTVGTDHRITTSSLLEYKRKDDHRRRLVADELTQLSQVAEHGDHNGPGHVHSYLKGEEKES